MILRSQKLSQKLFPPKWSLLNAQQKQKMGQDKWTWGSKLLRHLEILLSAHARTLKVNILHLDQKAAKGTTYYRQWPETVGPALKRVFRQNSQDQMG